MKSGSNNIETRKDFRSWKKNCRKKKVEVKKWRKKS